MSDTDGSNKLREQLRVKFKENNQWRSGIFWKDLDLIMDLIQTSDSWDRFYAIKENSLIGNFEVSDKRWLELALTDQNRLSGLAVAVEALIWIWRLEGNHIAQLDVIKKKLSGNAEMISIIEERTNRIISSKSSNWESENKRDEEMHLKKDAIRTKNWQQWRKSLLDSPSLYFTSKRTSSTIQNIYSILSDNCNSGCSYGAWNYELISEIFSEQVAQYSREAFKKKWRSFKPNLWSERAEEQRNSTPYVWIYGLCGVMAEAEENRAWTQSLTEEEAKLATRYATVEINGFAGFISDLARFRPVAIDEVLGTELTIQLSFGSSYSHLPMLQDLANADRSLKLILAHRLFDYLNNLNNIEINRSPNHWGHHLEQIFAILDETASKHERICLASICIREFKNLSVGPLSMIWLRGVFRFDAERAVSAFLDSYENEADVDRVANAFMCIFGSWDNIGLRVTDNDTKAVILGALVRCIYIKVPTEPVLEDSDPDKVDIPRGVARARSFLLSSLIETPGFRSQQILRELANEPSFRHFPDRLRQLAKERAAKDAEFEMWQTTEIRELEKIHEMPPWDKDSIFRVMIDRLEDLQHELWHDDFTNRKTIRLIGDEPEMQRAIAQRLRDMSKNLYQITREEEVADGKEPDIRMISRKNEVKAAIEIKIADDRWRLKQFETALRTQLVKQYLRHKDCKAGCLLLTYNGKQPTWSAGRKKKPLSFQDLVVHLGELAKSIEEQQNYEVRIAVFGLDLTDSFLKEIEAINRS